MSDTMTASAPETKTRSDARPGGFIWYELMTTDPEGAKAFYEPVVGWSMTTGHGENTDYGFITRSDGGMNGGVLRLSKEMSDGGARPGWMGYLHVADVDEAVRAVEASGGTSLMPARDVEMAGRIAMVADPQGAPFYMMTPKPPAGKEDMESDVFAPLDAQHVRWNELHSSDPEASVAFYTRLLGWAQEGEMEMGPLGKYRFVQNGGVGIGAIMPKMPQAPHSMWTYYIGVDDIDRATEAVSAGGGKVTDAPQEIPGGEFAVNGVDPQGAAFGLVGSRKG